MYVNVKNLRKAVSFFAAVARHLSQVTAQLLPYKPQEHLYLCIIGLCRLRTGQGAEVDGDEPLDFGVAPGELGRWVLQFGEVVAYLAHFLLIRRRRGER